jgi:GNAT superfamily N-acetyltransferase
MREVTRLLTAGLVRISVVDPESTAGQYCLGEYYAELGRRFEDGWDDTISIAATPEQLRPPAGIFVVATLRGDPVGCGALKFHARSPAELKRMWVAPSARGLGLGRRLLTELERIAAEHGARRLRLETNRTLIEAIALYRSAGYREVPAFNDEAYAHHWFEKRL